MLDLFTIRIAVNNVTSVNKTYFKIQDCLLTFLLNRGKTIVMFCNIKSKKSFLWKMSPF